MSTEAEWDRVMTNPDNVIVSDSLRDLLDPEETNGEIQQAPDVTFTCSIVHDGSIVNGKLVTYTCEPECIKLVLECSRFDVICLIGASTIDSLMVTNSYDESTLSIELSEDDPDPTLEVNLNSTQPSQNSATVTIAISKVAE